MGRLVTKASRTFSQVRLQLSCRNWHLPLGPEDQVVAESPRLLQHRALRGLGHVDEAGAVVLRLRLLAEPAVELLMQVVLVAGQQRVRTMD